MITEPTTIPSIELHCDKCQEFALVKNGYTWGKTLYDPISEQRTKVKVRQWRCRSCNKAVFRPLYKGRYLTNEDIQSWVSQDPTSSAPDPVPADRRLDTHLSMTTQGSLVSITTKSLDIRTVEDALAYSHIDVDNFIIVKTHINSWEVTIGGTKSGTGQPETFTNYQVSVDLKPKLPGFDIKTFKQELIAELKSLAVPVTKADYPTVIPRPQRRALEINIFDLHYGKLAWKKETLVADYDMPIAEESFFTALEALIIEGMRFAPFEEIVFPIGNDFFNSDKSYPFPQTTKGTPQQDDGRWQKVFHQGRLMIYKAIERLKLLAPVKVYVIPGNHDKERSFFLGEAVEARYFYDENVEVICGASPQKYWHYGQNLIGFIHNAGRGAQGEKRLLTLMQRDVPQLWAQTKFHEWHMGDIHHKKMREITSEEDIQGIKLKWLRTLMPPDSWENEEFYRSLKGAEAHVWDYNYGLVNTIHYNLVH